jgi:hypothetical protein
MAHRAQQAVPRALERVRLRAAREAGRYARGEDRPLAGYWALLAAYGALAGGISLALRDRLPERIDPTDLALLGAATFKVSRLLARDPVTSPVRAPFTQFEGQGGPSEVEESPRKDSALRHALGELVTCPFCIGQWVATAFATGLLVAPRATRLVASTMTVVAAADALQLAYGAAQQAVEG